MKNGKKCWKMKSIAGIILTCIFLTACGEETKELMTGNDELKILEEVEKTEDRETVYELAGDFTKSYFQEEYTGDVQIMGIKGLSGVGADNSTDCTVEVEFRPVQEDSLSYLFMTFRYDEMGWDGRSAVTDWKSRRTQNTKIV